MHFFSVCYSIVRCPISIGCIARVVFSQLRKLFTLLNVLLYIKMLTGENIKKNNPTTHYIPQNFCLIDSFSVLYSVFIFVVHVFHVILSAFFFQSVVWFEINDRPFSYCYSLSVCIFCCTTIHIFEIFSFSLSFFVVSCIQRSTICSSSEIFVLLLFFFLFLSLPSSSSSSSLIEGM